MSVNWRRMTALSVTVSSFGAVPLAASIDGWPMSGSPQTLLNFAILWSGFFFLLALSGLAFVLRLNMDQISLDFFTWLRRRREMPDNHGPSTNRLIWLTESPHSPGVRTPPRAPLNRKCRGRQLRDPGHSAPASDRR